MILFSNCFGILRKCPSFENATKHHDFATGNLPQKNIKYMWFENSMQIMSDLYIILIPYILIESNLKKL